MTSLKSDLLRRTRHFSRKISRPSEITLSGVKLGFPGNIGAKLRDALYREDYELNELHALRALLKPGDRILDVGSSIGFLTIYACKKVGAENVVAIEANPLVSALAHKNFERNGVSPTLYVGMAAANASENRKTFYVYDDFWASSEFSQKGNSGEQRIECEVIPVNSVIEERNINFLVCDIEGGEIGLLSKLNLDRLKTLIIEFHPEISAQEEIRSTVLYILNAGFSIDIRASTGDTLVFTHI